MKFHGSPEELKKKIEASGVPGQWPVVSEERIQFRSQRGTVLNWWKSTGTISFQGPETDRQALEAVLNKDAPMAVSSDSQKNKIFIVHGHDATAREQLELILHKLGLDPFILMNTSGDGLTIIEALESQIGKKPSAEFGIVLMTPDDVGYAKRDGEKEAKPRARQNVILEMGMLMSSLTRERVAILVKGFIEVPSDAHGVIYLHFNDHVKEVVPKLADRLRKAGMPITPEQIANASC